MEVDKMNKAVEVVRNYKKAMMVGTEKAWARYHKWLEKTAKEENAISAQAYEDWAYNYTFNNWRKL